MSEVARDTVLYQPDRGRPPSPRHNLPASRRDSGRLSSQSERSLELPSPSSPPLTRLTRKRAASLNTESANQALIDLSLSTASTARPPALDLTREQVCLCQPDPKIPRPRNAFILYRQHYQAQVVQQHPGLANPEISKIIGEQWREQTPEIKSEWKRLAEEEKSRHQRQYPDYRYQPRRAGKVVNNRPVPTSSTDDICPKCHGRYISTPSTPITPFTPSFNFRSDRVLPPFAPGASQERSRPSLPSGMSANRTNTPSQASHPRRPFPASQSGNLQLGSLREHHDEDSHMLSPSPDFKRRRMNEDARLRNNYAPSPTGYGPPQQRSGRPPMSALGPGYQTDPRERRDSFSGPPSAMLRQQPQSHHIGMMEPPPRPSSNGLYPRGPPTGRAQTFDESLRLPPLQTQMNDTRPRPSVMTSQPHNRDAQAKSVEAMVMTIPFLNKIKVLAKISPPLATPGPMSPAPETRGAIIAVEGPDKDLVASVGNFLKNHLEREAEFLIKTWPCELRPDSPTLPNATIVSQQGSNKVSGEQEKEKGKSDVDSEMTDANATVDPSHVTLKAPNTNNSNPTESTTHENQPNSDLDAAQFLNYLDTIRSWHQKSQDIIKFITSNPPPQNQNSQSADTSHQQKPIALLPSGFSLTISDYYARSIPINDAYAPVDHWQWMATLWRGIVGPDLTIYLDSPNSATTNSEIHSAVGNGGGMGMGSMGPPAPGVDGVDVKRDCGAIVVRCGEKVGGGGSVEDKTLRRLGFEVLEYVRAEQGRGMLGGL